MTDMQLVWVILVVVSFIVGVLVGAVLFRRPGSGIGDEGGGGER